MRLTLLESDRSALRSAEYATVSIVAHIAVICLALATTTGTFRLPTTEREARVLFLLPPDRVDAPKRESDIFLPGRPGSGLDQGGQLPAEGEGRRLEATSSRARHRGERSAARSDEPFGPAAFLTDSVFSVLQVDQMVERFEGSAAPVYPPELSARGTEGQVEAAYVVDTTGRVDMATIQVMRSDDPRFTESVRTALGETRFRPAIRAGKAVRQLVQQRFRFKLATSEGGVGRSL
ncbi:MAG: energy transducer TonB [Gemmatimonadales bacterium]